MGGKGSGRTKDAFSAYYGVCDPKHDYNVIFVGTMPEVMDFCGLSRTGVLARVRRARAAGVMGSIFKLDDESED